jgi:hypothetical protein
MLQQHASASDAAAHAATVAAQALVTSAMASARASAAEADARHQETVRVRVGARVCCAMHKFDACVKNGRRCHIFSIFSGVSNSPCLLLLFNTLFI